MHATHTSVWSTISPPRAPHDELPITHFLLSVVRGPIADAIAAAVAVLVLVTQTDTDTHTHTHHFCVLHVLCSAGPRTPLLYHYGEQHNILFAGAR